jgi:hypothetical protein
VGAEGGSSATRGELCAMYVISPFASVDSSMVRTAVYVRCCGSRDSAASAPAASESAVSMGSGAGGGLKGWYRFDRTYMPPFSGALSRCSTSAFRYDSAVIAALTSSVSSFHCSCRGPSLILSSLPVTASILFSVLDKVEMTSDGFVLTFVRDVKMAAKASSVTVLGKLLVVEMGRCREKKAEALISAKEFC